MRTTPRLNVATTFRADRAQPSSESAALLLIVAADAPRYTIVAMNSAFARAFGAQASALLGFGLCAAAGSKGFGPAGIELARVVASLDRVIDTGRPDAVAIGRGDVRGSGETDHEQPGRWWSATHFPMFGAGGRVCQIVHRLQDVTNQVYMELAREAWLTAVAQAPRAALCDASAAFATEGRTQRTTRPQVLSRPHALLAKTMLVIDDDEQRRGQMLREFSQQQFLAWGASDGHDGLALFALERPRCVVISLAMAGLDGAGICRAIRRMPDGADTIIVVTGAQPSDPLLERAWSAGADDAMPNGSGPAELVARVDALLEATGKLDEPLRTYCRRLRQLRHSAIRGKQLQDQAAADVVHDLKQPLSNVDLRIALMLDDAALSPTSRHSIERVRKQVHAMLRQVEDLLDMHRWDDAGQVASVQMFDLAATVRELLESFDISAAARGVALETAIEVSAVAADRGLLSRMLANLVDNALQHAPKGSVVQITAARATDGSGVDLHVSDAGAGVPIELGQRIFERFVQAPAKGHAPGRIHHGIGLAFCKAVAQAHGGHISVGRQNARTVFTVHLPNGAACDCRWSRTEPRPTTTCLL